MFGDVIIACLSLLILILEFYIYFTKKKYPFATKVAGMILLIIFIVTILIPNSSNIINPFIDEISGQLIDSETNEPISGATVVVRWIVTNAYFPDKPGGAEYKVLISNTNERGVFQFNKIRKPLSFEIFPIFMRGGVKGGILPFCENYEFEPSAIVINRNIVLRLNRIKSAQQLRRNLEEYSNWTKISTSTPLIQIAYHYKDITYKRLMATK